MNPSVAMTIIEEMVDEFPGLMDQETEVNGSDLVAWITSVLDDVYAGRFTN